MNPMRGLDPERLRELRQRLVLQRARAIERRLAATEAALAAARREAMLWRYLYERASEQRDRLACGLERRKRHACGARLRQALRDFFDFFLA